MGTTLTGTTPQDTYDSLIKVTDNGPLSATAKFLSDGLGNDSVLALSTTLVGIGTNAPATKLDVRGSSGTIIQAKDSGAFCGVVIDAAAASTPFTRLSVNAVGKFEMGYFNSLYYLNNNTGVNDTGAAMVITSTGNVGIGTSTASRVLTLKNNAGATNGISFQSLASTSEIAAIECNQTLDTIDFEMYSAFAGNGFRFLTGTTLVERARFTANGLTFNGDTAAANALDDYEEGTFTPTLVPLTSGTITVSTNSCRYTKIGRQVYVQGLLTASSFSSPVGAAILLANLPFTIGGSDPTQGRFSGSVITADASAAYVRTLRSSFGAAGNTYATLDIDASTLDTNDEVMFSITYTV